MNPLGIASIPADVLSALRLLPGVSARLEQIADNTDVLPSIIGVIVGSMVDSTPSSAASARTPG